MCQQTDGNCANTALQQRGGRAARPGGTGPGFRTRRGASWFPDRACTPSLFIPPPCTQREGNTPVGQLIKRGLQGLPWSQRLRLHASTAGDTGLIPGPVTKIVQAMRCGQEKKKRTPALGTSRLETVSLRHQTAGRACDSEQATQCQTVSGDCLPA